jgi:hypothetical protein
MIEAVNVLFIPLLTVAVVYREFGETIEFPLAANLSE